jgi:mono/diheme cytochrome c family protein
MTRLETGLAGVAAALLIAACTGGGQGSGEADARARRLAFRETLKAELGREYDRPLPPLDPQEVARGAQIYSRLCESCHGLGGRGNGISGRMLKTPPPDLGNAEQAAFYSDRAKLQIVEDGAPGTPMIGWTQLLTEEECRIVLQYLLDLASPPAGPGQGLEDG